MFKSLKRKKNKQHNLNLLEDYNKGKILQVNNGMDNKLYFKKVGENLNEFNKQTEEENN